MIKTKEIELALSNYYGTRQNLIVPNVSWGLNIHECDMLVIRPSNWAIEIEIKISKSDLKADLKKEHQHKSNLLKELWFAMPDEYVDDWIEFVPKRAGVLGVKKILATNGKITYYSTYQYRQAELNRNARKLNDIEIAKVGKLGVMRYWNNRRKGKI